MRRSPFLDDPRDLLTHHVALAVASPLEDVRAIHIRAAEHQAELARASGLPLAPTLPGVMGDPTSPRSTRSP